MKDIKRYREIEVADNTQIAPAFVIPTTNEDTATIVQPQAYEAAVQFDTTGKVYEFNMGQDAAAGIDDHNIQHFCIDCSMPFRNDRMIFFRGNWYGVPCGCYKHAVDIRRKELQRVQRPVRRNEPGDIPLITSTNW
jgi:hypothetical protein